MLLLVFVLFCFVFGLVWFGFCLVFAWFCCQAILSIEFICSDLIVSPSSQVEDGEGGGDEGNNYKSEQLSQRLVRCLFSTYGVPKLIIL